MKHVDKHEKTLKNMKNMQNKTRTNLKTKKT